METIKLTVDNAPDLKFAGEELATTRSPEQCGRWQRLALYRTKAGKYVAYRVNVTHWAKENDTHEAAICETEDEIVKFLGYSNLAKELYALAKIQHEKSID